MLEDGRNASGDDSSMGHMPTRHTGMSCARHYACQRRVIMFSSPAQAMDKICRQPSSAQARRLTWRPRCTRQVAGSVTLAAQRPLGILTAATVGAVIIAHHQQRELQ